MRPALYFRAKWRSALGLVLLALALHGAPLHALSHVLQPSAHVHTDEHEAPETECTLCAAYAQHDSAASASIPAATPTDGVHTFALISAARDPHPALPACYRARAPPEPANHLI